MATLSVEDCIADAMQPSTNGWGPSLNPVWGWDSQGDPTTGSYAYASTFIRLTDRGPSGSGVHNPANAYLEDTTFLDPGATDVSEFPWFVLDDAYQARNSALNTRFQMDGFTHLIAFLDGTWITSDSDTMHRSLNTFAAWYWFWGDLYITITDGSAIDQARLETNGCSLGAIGMTDKAGTGWCVHGFPCDPYQRTRNEWVNLIAGSVVYMRGQLIKHDSGGADDSANANILVNMGADYTRPGAHLGESYHSRWKLATTTAQYFYGTNLTPAFLRAHPPPGFSTGSSPAPSPTPSPAPAPAPAPATVVPTAQRWWAPTHGWLAKSAPARPVMTTTSLTSATAGTSGTQSVAASGPGTVTFAAVGLPSGAVLDPDGTLTWDTSLVAAVYTVTITPTSSDTGAGMPVAYQWTVLPAGTASDPGAWAPHLRKRLA